jgi:hypothetical protein
MKVLEYCEHHKNEPLPAADSNDADDARRKASEIGEWDAKFIQVRVCCAQLCACCSRARAVHRRSDTPTKMETK